MLAHRIQATDSLTWGDLCKSLRHVSVGRSDVADEMERCVSGNFSQTSITQKLSNKNVSDIMCIARLFIYIRVCKPSHSHSK